MSQERPQLQVRDRRYHYEEVPKYYDSGNVVLTHEWNALSLIIPSGERYFIRSVQRLAPRAKNPGLKLQIKGFIGQEAMHSKETSRSIESLEKRGFPVHQFEANFERFLSFLERWLPSSKGHLAATAAVEHYTAVLSEWHLGNRYFDRVAAPIRNLNQWHAAEELEHKAVAFDLLQEVSRNYVWRIIGYVLGMGLTWLFYRKALRQLLKWEGLTRAQIREERRKAREIRIPIMGPGFPNIFAFLKPRFHPSDLDDGALAKQILARQAAGADGGYE